ncbi:MAG: hypothetical protein LIO46_03060 [Clostridiales bacterium]|nr:hypothetical protein [Clostridiales bacterium]
MTYDEGKKYMQQACSPDAVREIKNRKLQTSIDVWQDLCVYYPGYKKAVGDYRLVFVPKHRHVCLELYDAVTQKKLTYERAVTLLAHTYHNGTRNLVDGSYAQFLQHLIYWVTLQEEINYPRDTPGRSYAGRNLPYCRYFEAVYATKNRGITLEMVLNRCENRGQRKPELYHIPQAPDYYHY